MIPVTLKGNLKQEHVLLQVILIYAMQSQIFFFLSLAFSQAISQVISSWQLGLL